MLILRCVLLGELPRPLPGARLSGSSLSCEAPGPWQPLVPGGPAPSRAQGDTGRNNKTGSGQFCSPGVSSRSNYRSSQSTGAWMLRGLGALICTGLDRPAAEGPLCPVPSPPPPVPRGATDPGLCPPAPWSRGPVRLEWRSQGAQPPLCGASA